MNIAAAAAIGIPVGLLFALMKHDSSSIRDERRAQQGLDLQRTRRSTQESLAQQRNIESMREVTRAQLGGYLSERGVPYGYYGGRGMESYIADSGARHGS